MQIFFFALRNFNRSRTRTRITVGAMAFACAIMIFYASLLEGWLAGMEKNAVGMDLGEVQIHARGFRADPDLYKLIDAEESVLALLGREGFVAAPRGVPRGEQALLRQALPGIVKGEGNDDDELNCAERGDPRVHQSIRYVQDNPSQYYVVSDL